MRKKIISEITHELSKTFPAKIVSIKHKIRWIEIELMEGDEITFKKLSALLAITVKYDLHISVYAISDNQLGMLLWEK